MRFLIILSVLAVSTPCFADQPELKSAKAKAAIAEFDRSQRNLNAQFEAALTKLKNTHADETEKHRQKLFEDLNEALKEATQKADLDEAIAIRDAINALKEGGEDQPKETVASKTPNAAIKFKGHSYMAIHLHGVSWEQAKLLCEKMGGHLATVNNGEEFEVLKKIIGPNKAGDRNLWLGARFQNGRWRWLDGSAVDDSLWGKPPANKPGFHYVYMTGLGTVWNNFSPCETIPGFICEWEK